jgi:hypothetical protein
MPTMSFKKTVEDVKASETSGNAEILEITEETALVPSPKKELANLTNAAGDVIGEFDTKDIRLPYLRIVQKISDDASTFGSGSILFNGEVKLATEGNPIRMTFVQMQKFYEEKLPMQAEKRPLICDTAEEVLKAGGSFNMKDEHYFAEVVMLRVVLERPETISEQDSLLFPYKAPNGKWYAMALWTARGTAYGQTGPVLYTASLNFLAEGLYHGEWNVSTEKRTNSKGSWHVPSLRFNGKHEGEMLDFMLRLSGRK